MVFCLIWEMTAYFPMHNLLIIKYSTFFVKESFFNK